MQPIRHQPVQMNADKVSMVVLRSGGLARPQAAQRRNQRLIILTLAQFQLTLPPASRETKVAYRFPLAARKRISNSQPDVARPKARGAQTHSRLVQQLMRNRPCLFRRAHIWSQHVLMT